MSPKFFILVCLGFWMDQRIWAQVGGPDRPSLTAWPSQIVPQGQRVTLRCHSPLGFAVFKLYTEKGPLVSELQNALLKNDYVMGPVTPAHAGIYRCYGAYQNSTGWSAHSNPLKIIVTGLYREPSLSAQPGPLVKLGDNMTLRCCSEVMFDTYILHKEEEPKDPLSLVERFHGGSSQADFSLGAMTSAHAGTYRCYGSLRHSLYNWSAPSPPLKLVITGLYKKPSLTAQLGPGVMSGGNVTLCCRSESSLDVFHLVKEGEAHDSWFSGVQSHNGTCQADFSLGPMTPALGGAYRCYGSFQHSPYEWSEPSDPLVVSAPILQDYTVENLIRMGGAGLTFVALLVVLAEAWWGLRVHSVETEETS